MLITKENHKIDNIENIIINATCTSDYIKGRRYHPLYVNPTGMIVEKNKIKANLEVESKRTYDYYKTSYIIDDKKNIIDTKCSCLQYQSTKSCKHIAASIWYTYEEVAHEAEKLQDNKNIALELFEYINKTKEDKKNIKQKLNIQAAIDTEINY